MVRQSVRWYCRQVMAVVCGRAAAGCELGYEYESEYGFPLSKGIRHTKLAKRGYNENPNMAFSTHYYNTWDSSEVTL